MAQTKTITERDLTELSERPAAPGVAPKSWQESGRSFDASDLVNATVIWYFFLDL